MPTAKGINSTTSTIKCKNTAKISYIHHLGTHGSRLGLWMSSSAFCSISLLFPVARSTFKVRRSKLTPRLIIARLVTGTGCCVRKSELNFSYSVMKSFRKMTSDSKAVMTHRTPDFLQAVMQAFYQLKNSGHSTNKEPMSLICTLLCGWPL